MSPMDPPASFLEQYLNLLPDSDLTEFQKILEMKVYFMTKSTVFYAKTFSNFPFAITAFQPLISIGRAVPNLNALMAFSPCRIAQLIVCCLNNCNTIKVCFFFLFCLWIIYACFVCIFSNSLQISFKLLGFGDPDGYGLDYSNYGIDYSVSKNHCKIQN